MSSETSTAASGSETRASGASAQAASSSTAGEELNLIPQWLKRGPSASPRHAQAPPPPPAPANPQRERSIGASGSSNSRNTESRGERQVSGDRDRERTGGGGRFQSFVQSEQQRRPPQANASSVSLQGTFEGGRFTMPGSDSGPDSRLEPRGGRGGGGRGDYHRHSQTTGGRADYSQQERPPRVGRSAHGGDGEYQSWRDLPSTSSTNRIQYTRDELLDLAVPSSLESAQLSSETPEGIISAEWIEPELKKPIDSEEIYNAWYESLQSERSGRGQTRGGGGPSGGGPASGQNEGPPRVDWRNPPNWRAAPQAGGSAQSRSDMRTFGNLNNNDARGSILPPSGGMGLDKMAEAAEKFAREMQEAMTKGGGTMFGRPEASKATPPAQLQGLLGEKTGNSILDEPLEEGLDAPPEEEVVPKEEAIDYDGVNDAEEKLTMPSSSAKQQSETMSMKRVQDELPSVQIPQVKLPDMGGGLHQQSSMLPQVPLVSLEAFKPAMGGTPNQPSFGTAAGGPASTLPRMMDPWGASNPIEHTAGRGSALMAGLGGGLDLLSPGGVFPPSMPSQMKPSQHLPSSPQPQQMRSSTLLPPARAPVVGGAGMIQGGLFGQMPQSSPQAPQQPPKMMPPYSQSQMADEWFYKDPQNATQGPFSSLEMKEWLEAGYFKPDLPISYGQHGTGKFVPLAALYSDIRSAFTIPPPKMALGGMPGGAPGSNSSGIGALPASLGPTIMPMAQVPLPQSIPSQQQQALMQQQQQQQMAAKQRMMEEHQRATQQQQQQAAALEQQQRAQQEEQRQKAQREQLKHETDEKARREAEELEKQRAQSQHQAAQQQNAAKSKNAATPPAWSTASQSSQTPTLAQIRAEEERLKKEQEKQKQQQLQQQKTTMSTPTVNAATPATKTQGTAAAPWGKSIQEPVRTPTLKEIQEAEEEERKRQQQSKELPPLTMASHLAKAAGIETRTWSAQVASSGSGGNEPKKAIPQAVLAPPAPVQQQQRPAQVKSAGSASMAGSTSKQSPSASSGGAPQAQQQASSKKESDVVYNANAQMSAELKAWCQENASKIGADMALLEFCYGMENGEEVRDTFTGYLGLKPQVTSFVDEYLRRVNLDRASDSRTAHDTGGEWKDAKGATGKAGKKKRG